MGRRIWGCCILCRKGAKKDVNNGFREKGLSSEEDDADAVVRGSLDALALALGAVFCFGVPECKEVDEDELWTAGDVMDEDSSFFMGAILMIH